MGVDRKSICSLLYRLKWNYCEKRIRRRKVVVMVGDQEEWCPFQILLFIYNVHFANRRRKSTLVGVEGGKTHNKFQDWKANKYGRWQDRSWIWSKKENETNLLNFVASVVHWLVVYNCQRSILGEYLSFKATEFQFCMYSREQECVFTHQSRPFFGEKLKPRRFPHQSWIDWRKLYILRWAEKRE